MYLKQVHLAGQGQEMPYLVQALAVQSNPLVFMGQEPQRPQVEEEVVGW
jgi:hypothetical protein